ncbi:hypothetical protein M2266_004343 [Streptomyces sp. SPB162]|nr:hypothetical protein [Streptomyces sp. SPB162]
MKRHGFEPASLVMGLVLLGIAAAFLLDAAGGWDPSRQLTVSLAAGGLAFAAVTSVVTRVVRRGRRNDGGPAA